MTQFACCLSPFSYQRRLRRIVGFDTIPTRLCQLDTSKNQNLNNTATSPHALRAFFSLIHPHNPLPTSHKMRFSHVSIFCAYLCLKTSATCYYPNGTADSTGQQAPCNTSGHSMCCLLANVTASNADTCRSDGLCVPFDNSVLYRDLCTDPTWKDPACLDLCLTGLGTLSRLLEGA